VIEEGKWQLDGVCDAPEPFAKSMGGLSDLVGTEVSKLACFDVVPDSFGRIQIGGVSRQPLNFEPVPLLEQEPLHDFALVGREMIPDQDYLSPSDEAFQTLEKGDETVGVEAVWLGSGE